MAKLTVRDLNVHNKRVFVRVDYNVPLEEKDGQMVITDDTRIVETLPTLRLLIEKGARLILAAHLGRPKGQREPTMSLRPVAAKLAELLGCQINFADDCIGEKVESLAKALPPGGVVLLENVRYYKEEEANDLRSRKSWPASRTFTSMTHSARRIVPMLRRKAWRAWSRSVADRARRGC